jgi:hypothetical protein
VTGRDHPDGVEELPGSGVLQEEAAGPRAQGREHSRVEVEHGEDQHPYARSGRGRADPLGRRDTVEDRHPYVHQDYVRLEPPGQCDGLLTGTGLAHHKEIRLGVDEHPEAAAQQRLVVRHQHPDRLSH